MNNSNKIVFTDWYTVSIISNDREIELPVPKFLKELEKELKGKDYNVFFNSSNNKFIITYDGVDYDVIFNQTEQKNILSHNYSPLVLKLLYLATKEKKYNDEEALQAVRKKKVEVMDDSNYEVIETVEDYELYLDYLKANLKKVKNNSEKNVINTKIANIVQIIDKMKKEKKQQEENPLNLQMHINRFVYDILKDIDKLDETNRKKIAGELKKILLDFKKMVDDYNKKKANGLFLGDPMVPMEILERIIDVEFKIKDLLRNNEIVNLVNSEFSDTELFDVIKNGFKNEDYIKWDKEYIPKDYNFKLKRFFNNSILAINPKSQGQN